MKEELSSSYNLIDSDEDFNFQQFEKMNNNNNKDFRNMKPQTKNSHPHNIIYNAGSKQTYHSKFRLKNEL